MFWLFTYGGNLREVNTISLNDIISFITNNNYEHIYLILSAGKKTFQHVKEYVEDIVLVTDEEIKRLANLSV